MVSYAFGSIFGMIYAGLLNLILNSVGMGSGVIIYVLLTQMFEAGLIGLLKIKKIEDILNIFLISLILSLIVKPTSFIFYNVFGGEINNFFYNLSKMYITYLKTGFVSNLITYIISGTIAHTIYKIVNSNIFKRKEEIIL